MPHRQRANLAAQLRYPDFDIQVQQQDRGVKIELLIAPAVSFVGGEILRNARVLPPEPGGLLGWPLKGRLPRRIPLQMVPNQPIMGCNLEP